MGKLVSWLGAIGAILAIVGIGYGADHVFVRYAEFAAFQQNYQSDQTERRINAIEEHQWRLQDRDASPGADHQLIKEELRRLEQQKNDLIHQQQQGPVGR